jgi:hypothetical protein
MWDPSARSPDVPQPAKVLQSRPVDVVLVWLLMCSVLQGAGSYVSFPNMNITGNVDINPFSDTPYLGASGSFLSMATLMSLCEDPAQEGQCRALNPGGYLKSWPNVDANYQSFLSNSTCGTKGTATLSTGTNLSPPGTQYLVCTGAGTTDASLVTFATFQLPPFLVEEACDKNPACVGFMVSTDQTQGWLLQYNVLEFPVYPYFLVRLS